MNIKFLSICLLLHLIVGCSTKTAEIKNKMQGHMERTVNLEIINTKKFTLDSGTAPKPRYTQIYTDSKGSRYFTFLNTYTNSIYFYDYNTLEFIEKITCNKNESDTFLQIEGYYIKNIDSIYLYNRPLIELLLITQKSRIIDKISLKGNGDPIWFNYLPQYYPQTVNPFIETNDELLFTGQYFESIPKSMLNHFKFTAHIDLKSHKVVFMHPYPEQLYGSGYNWDGGRPTTAFPELHPDGDKLIFSFPVSHDLYITSLNSNNYQKIYGGSNFAGTICSIHGNPKNTSRNTSAIHYIQQDMYSAIKYDRFNKVYYRFLLRGIPGAVNRAMEKEKPISIIIMDENFNYMGETTIGTCKDWYWQNSFVTKEGLNIEYLEKNIDEEYLILKIFTLKKI